MRRECLHGDSTNVEPYEWNASFICSSFDHVKNNILLEENNYHDLIEFIVSEVMKKKTNSGITTLFKNFHDTC